MPNNEIKKILSKTPWSENWHFRQANKHADPTTLRSVFALIAKAFPVVCPTWRTGWVNTEPLLYPPHNNDQSHFIYQDAIFLAILTHADIKLLNQILSMEYVQKKIRLNGQLYQLLLIHTNPQSLHRALNVIAQNSAQDEASLPHILRQINPYESLTTPSGQATACPVFNAPNNPLTPSPTAVPSKKDMRTKLKS